MDEVRVTRKDALVAAGTVGAVGAGALGFAGVIGLVGDNEEPEAPAVTVTRVPSPVPADDPQAAAWDDTPETVVPMLAQQLVAPPLPTLGVSEVKVRALHDDARLAFRLQWEDGSVENLDGIGAFHDAVAVMVPRGGGAKRPPITMGAPGQPVDVFQWRATWQRDVDANGRTGVDQIYPRVVHDVMPDDVLPPQTAALYWVGRAAGNPLSKSRRTTPVERIVAEGFGSTTHVPTSDAVGRGVHDGSTWHVALGYPLAGMAAAPRAAAFAIWLGSQDNRGGRKQYADWVPLRFGGVA